MKGALMDVEIRQRVGSGLLVGKEIISVLMISFVMERVSEGVARKPAKAKAITATAGRGSNSFNAPQIPEDM
jgi:hypothetical protein